MLHSILSRQSHRPHCGCVRDHFSHLLHIEYSQYRSYISNITYAVHSAREPLLGSCRVRVLRGDWMSSWSLLTMA